MRWWCSAPALRSYATLLLLGMAQRFPIAPLPELLTQWSRARGSRLAFVQMLAGGSWGLPYRDLERLVARAAQWIAAAGVREGDRVVLWGPNSVDWVVGFFGIVWRGAIPVPVDTHAPAAVARAIAQDAGAILAIQSLFHPESIAPTTLPLERLRQQSRTLSPLAPVIRSLDAPLLFAYTSGTTATPKGVVLSSRAVLSNAAAAKQAFALDHTTRAVSVLPLSHMFECTAGLLVPLLAGGTIVYPRAAVAGAIFEALASGPTTHMVLVPRLLETFRKAIFRKVAAEGKERVLASLLRIAPLLPMRMRRWLFWPIARRFGRTFQYFVCGGAPLAHEVADFWERLGFPVYEGYGLTEHSPIVAANTPVEAKKGTVGKPLPGVEVRLGESGELLVRSEMVMEGYYRNPEKTAEVLQGGWLATGDVAEIDEEGFIAIRGRVKEMILTEGGFNVYPDEVEDRLREHSEQVLDACVVGCRKEGKGGEEVTAAIVSNAPDAAVAQVVAAVNAQLPKPARIRRWVRWVGPFPQTPTLKTKRTKVAREVCSKTSGADVPATITHESPVLGELTALANTIVGAPRFHADNAHLPLPNVEPQWGAWEWWWLLRSIEHTFYYTIPPSLVAAPTSLRSLAATLEQRPLPEPVSPPIRRLPAATEVALTGITLIDEREAGARRWLSRARTPCVALQEAQGGPAHVIRVLVKPHPEYIGAFSRLLRRRPDRALVWWLPAEGPLRSSTLVLASLIAYHSRKPLWIPTLDEEGKVVLQHRSLTLSHDIGPKPEWLKALEGDAKTVW